MNEFDSIQTNSGILKDSYGKSELQEALKRKRLKLTDTKLGPKDEEDESTS